MRNEKRIIEMELARIDASREMTRLVSRLRNELRENHYRRLKAIKRRLSEVAGEDNPLRESVENAEEMLDACIDFLSENA